MVVVELLSHWMKQWSHNGSVIQLLKIPSKVQDGGSYLPIYSEAQFSLEVYIEFCIIL